MPEMANVPRGMLAGPNGRAMNVFPDGRSVFGTQAKEQQVINRAEMVSSLPASTQEVKDASRAVAVASNTAAHEASQAQFDSAAGTLANLMNDPAQRCCFKHKVRAFPGAYLPPREGDEEGGPLRKLGGLLYS